MQNFILSPQELASLRASHKAEKQKPDAYRINAVILLGSGWTLQATSDALLLDEETLRSYVKKYSEGGLEELLRTNYQGRATKLPIEKMVEFEEHLKTHLYQTTSKIIDYVEKVYGVHYSHSGMADLLHRLGFTYKKPKLFPEKFDLELQDCFKEMMLKFFESKKDNEAVLFYDSAHPQYNTLSDYGWIKKGQEVALPSHSARGHVNVSGVIDIETLEVMTVYPDKVNSDSMVGFLQKIQKKYCHAEKVHIILDNASIHHSRVVKEFLEGSNINLVFLPPYSPNLNLIERLWGLMRREILANQHYKSFREFKDRIMDFFKGLKRKKEELLDLMTFEFQDFGSVRFT
jgi:transposase